jgi:twitching motility two-component system response regulator PilH
MPLILIIDDSPTEVHVLTRALERHGYQIASASGGAEGIRLAKTLKPDLILMDIVMPGINGFEATRLLSNDELTKQIPVVMVTNKDQSTDQLWAMRQGAVDYLVKPFTADDLLATVQSVLAP